MKLKNKSNNLSLKGENTMSIVKNTVVAISQRVRIFGAFIAGFVTKK